MFLIGLTGNIASGKSTVRAFLEEKGARSIDADALVHAILLPGRAAWHAVVTRFGPGVLRAGGRIDRRKLGQIVFTDPARLRELEAITHPQVRIELGLALAESRAEVIVVEAVKLIEGGLYRLCDSVWVVTCEPAEMKRRLIQDRHMTEAEADARLRAQPPLEPRLDVANVVIDNSGTREETRLQLDRAWQVLPFSQGADKTTHLTQLLGLALPASLPSVAAPVRPPSPPAAPARPSAPDPAPVLAAKDPPGPLPLPLPPAVTTPELTRSAAAIPVEIPVPRPPAGEIKVHRAVRGDLDKLAVLLARLEGRPQPLPRAETMQHFGRWGYWLAEVDELPQALVAWQTENLVGIARDFWFDSTDDIPRLLPPLLERIEAEAGILQCEVMILMVRTELSHTLAPTALTLGYAPQNLAELHRIWRQVAGEHSRDSDSHLVKRLREEITTKPI